MSKSSDRGRNFELKVAALIRKKLGVKVARDSRSGAGVNKSDIADHFQEIPFHLELKDHEKLNVKESMRQAMDGASFSRVPVMVFPMDETTLACIQFDDLLNLVLEIADYKAEIDDLRKPISPETKVTWAGKSLDDIPSVDVAIDRKKLKKAIERKTTFCRAGHVADEYGYCLQVTCKYSRGYTKPKGKKSIKGKG